MVAIVLVMLVILGTEQYAQILMLVWASLVSALRLVKIFLHLQGMLVMEEHVLVTMDIRAMEVLVQISMLASVFLVMPMPIALIFQLQH
jgi:hypothetical protein